RDLAARLVDIGRHLAQLLAQDADMRLVALVLGLAAADLDAFLQVAREFAHLVHRHQASTLVPHAQEAAAAGIAGESLLDIEVLFLAQLEPTLRGHGITALPSPLRSSSSRCRR